MRLFARLTWGKTAAAIDACLGPSTGRVGVVGAPALARLLGERREVVELATDGAYGGDGAADALGAVVVVSGDAPSDPDAGDPAATQLRELGQRLPTGGRLILLGRASRTEATRRALCAGLVELEQRALGGRLATLARTR